VETKTYSSKLTALIFYLLLSTLLSLCAVASSYSQASSQNEQSLLQAKNYFDSNQIEKARVLYKSIEEENCGAVSSEKAGDCVSAKIGLINITSQLGSAEESIVQAKEAISYLDEIDIQNESYQRTALFRILVLKNLGLSRLDKAGEWVSSIREQTINEENLRARALAQSVLGDYEDALGNYNKAISHYNAAIEMAEEVDSMNATYLQLHKLYNNLGVSFNRIGKLDEATVQFQASLDLIHEYYGFGNKNEALAFINLGGIYYSKGDIGLASEYFQRAVDIYKSLKGDYSDALGASLNNLAATQYMLGNFVLSARYFEEAQRIKEENLGLDHPDTAVGYSNLAAIHILNNDYDAAQANYERSIAVRENIYGPDHPNLIEPKISLGNLYTQQLEQHEQAQVHYESALSIALDRLGETHPVVTDIYLQIGHSYMRDARFPESEIYIDRALISLYGPFDFDEPLDPERTIADPVALLRALQAKSQILTQRHKGVDIEDYEDSLMALRWAANLVDLVQRSFKNEASKLQLVEKNYSIYTDAIEILSTLFDETGDEEYMDQIFNTIEKSRSRVTLELIQKVNANKFAGVPAEIILQEENLNSKITEMQQELHQEETRGLEKDSLRMDALRDSIFYYKRDLDNFTDELEEKYPSYYLLKYDQSIISRADAQSLLQGSETVLSYILGSERAHVMVMTKESVNLVELGESTGIKDLVLELKEYVLTENSEAYRQAAHKLYELLIQPAEQFITGNELIIMADQALHYLPFELLLKDVPQHNRYSRYPYLVHDYIFSYIPSLTLLDEMHSRKEDSPRNLLALAPFSSEMGQSDKALMDHQYSDRANPLYLTQYETASISSQFRSRSSVAEYFNPQKADLLMGENATFSRFTEKDLKDYDYIHFATHAFINEENPDFSAILLYPEEGNSGATFVGDIYNLELDANLVVLGACQTGLGSIFKGEGLIGFTRAFIYAGASNLAVSMWRVSDQPTAYLMIDFYDFIRQGFNYNEALHKAKINMISNPQFAHPVNWASFTLTGR